MILKDIAEKLEDEGIGTVGTDVFIGELPKNVENGIMLVSSLSSEQDKYVDIREAYIDIWVRNKSSEDAIAKLESIIDVLQRSANWQGDSNFVYFGSMMSDVEDLDRDIQDRKLLRLSMRFIYRKLTVS